MTAAAEQIAPMITEPLTWGQICERYPDQWVCVVEIVRAQEGSFHFTHARVFVRVCVCRVLVVRVR